MGAGNKSNKYCYDIIKGEITMKLDWQLADAVEIKLAHQDDFLKIKETLSRIGIPSIRQNHKTLYQTAHILHKKGRYYIIHFKCLFALDGKTALFNEEDWMRQNKIASLLDDWNLCSLVTPIPDVEKEDIKKIKIVKFSEKDDWDLVAKYTIGNAGE